MKERKLLHIISTVMLACFVIAIMAACSSPNTDATGVSSANAQFVTCPATSVETVNIVNLAFQSDNTSIAVNDIVRWTNNDSVIHTVTSGAPGSLDGTFDSGNIAQNASVCIQFLAPGTYPYFCNIHTFMKGTVSVQ